MPIEAIQFSNQMEPVKVSPYTNQSPAQAQQKFGDFLKNAIQDVNAAQQTSDQLTNKLIRGDQVELHDVMIASQQASVMLNATIEVRNKVIEAYQEMMRMTV